MLEEESAAVILPPLSAGCKLEYFSRNRDKNAESLGHEQEIGRGKNFTIISESEREVSINCVFSKSYSNIGMTFPLCVPGLCSLQL